ncbi:RagB/SusD family nutrient uptake outer membrane protein [Sphingobacterium hotanense]|uniref:RagB/SusD family nutrient uptake outer membrane protein n=1 Tax=Sphingobacterium hotanense TaxID=649196 RepID=UPI0021A5F62A|nr:RagB/SusD family nutrient uptake outer membrane protein [Sphingobacterium hotanense]MCT1524137.1 RagB/SusD family nutrient uptake outer membrane protein [Sphingobacterium hotanense]
MKTTYIKIFLPLVTLLSFNSCRDYVEVDQYNRRELKYTDDFQYLLNNEEIFGAAYSLPVLSSDDIIIAEGGYQTNMTELVYWPYTWAQEYFPNQLKDATWDNLYKQIYTTNEIITLVMGSQRGGERQKMQILAEAKVQRAYAYFLLVNQYGGIYNPETAQSTIGVPLLLKPDLSPVLNRVDLKTLYNQMLADLNEALSDLPDRAENNRHPDKAAVHAVLAMVYLHMRDFEQAGIHADEAMKGSRKLFNLPDYVGGKITTYPRRVEDTEIFISKKTVQQYNEQLNPELLALFETKDLRLQTYTKISQNSLMPAGALLSRKNEIAGVFPNTVDVGPSLPEMYLIKAEVLARKGQYNEAMEVVNELRKFRFKADELTLLSATNPDQALLKVVEERRRELFATGKRWFDQRRFNLDPQLAKAYNRTFKGEAFTLEVNSNRFVYPVASYYLDLNPEIGQSPR